MNNSVPYQHFKKAISNKLIDDGFFNPEWFATQEKRMQMFWNNGETSDSAYDVIGAIAEAKFSKHVVRDITISKMKSVGCEYQTV